MTRALKPRYCVACGTKFDARTTGIYCSNACRKGVVYVPPAPHPLIPCVICGAEFRRFNAQHKTCSKDCRAKRIYQQRSGRDADAKVRRQAKVVIIEAPHTPLKTKTPVVPVINRIPCASCQRGVPSTVSDTGWECAVHLAMRCKPLGNFPAHHQPIG